MEIRIFPEDFGMPKYKGLMDWIEAVKRPQFELLKASKQHGMYFAVFREPSGDLAFCYYRCPHGALQSGGTYVYRLLVQDFQGKDLRDRQSDKDKMLSREFNCGGCSGTVVDGEMYPLVKPVPDQVRLTFTVTSYQEDVFSFPLPTLLPTRIAVTKEAHRDTLLFDEIVEIR